MTWRSCAVTSAVSAGHVEGSAVDPGDMWLDVQQPVFPEHLICVEMKVQSQPAFHCSLPAFMVGNEPPTTIIQTRESGVAQRRREEVWKAQSGA